MAGDLILVRRFEDYEAALQKAFVVLDADRRKEIILADARNLAFARGLELVEDEALLEEVAGLVEWPVVLVGSFDPEFLAIPPEVVRATIRANQKCFVLRDPVTGKLSNHFVLVANIEASDGGAKIVGGNERVVRARLSDARHFWDTDQRDLPDYATPENSGKPLDQRLAKLKKLGIIFHEKLGTQGERVERITALARELAPLVGADPDLAARAAQLCKADLVTEMVGEFPEVQGLMGRRYAELQGEHPSVAAAIEEHYKPQGPSDRVPTDPVSVAVALADKLDTLVGFWAIDEKPTGSKDPYALRRAALGVVRLVLENGLRALSREGNFATAHGEWYSSAKSSGLILRSHLIGRHFSPFFHDRLKVYLRDRARGTISSTLCCILDRRVEDDLLMIVRRVEALGRFLETEDGKNLLAGYKRAANILRIEEKKDGRSYADPVDAHILRERGLPEEKVLAEVLDVAERHAREHVAARGFRGRDDRAGAASPRRRRVLRQGHRQRRRCRSARQPPAPALAPARSHPHRR